MSLWLRGYLEYPPGGAGIPFPMRPGKEPGFKKRLEEGFGEEGFGEEVFEEKVFGECFWRMFLENVFGESFCINDNKFDNIPEPFCISIFPSSRRSPQSPQKYTTINPLLLSFFFNNLAPQTIETTEQTLEHIWNTNRPIHQRYGKSLGNSKTRSGEDNRHFEGIPIRADDCGGGISINYQKKMGLGLSLGLLCHRIGIMILGL